MPDAAGRYRLAWFLLRGVICVDCPAARLNHPYGGVMAEPNDDIEQLERQQLEKRLAEQSGGYGGPGVEAEETPEQRAAENEADSGEDIEAH
jgi:hypothetical protein